MPGLLIDTDIFCKVGAAGLLDDLADMLGTSLSCCARLPALPYMLQKGPLRTRYGEAACSALIPIAEKMMMVPTASLAWSEKLAHIEDINPGEVQIFAAAAELGVLCATGDKRSLRALKDVEDFQSILAGRIVVLEAAMLALCEAIGADKVRQQVAPVAGVDSVLKMCFSTATEDPCVGLSSYFAQIVGEVAPLTLWQPGSSCKK